MARSNFRGGRRGTKDVNRRVKKKPCALCRERVVWVDYKDVPLLRKYMSDRGKIRSRRVTGNCAQHQRDVAQAIKTARELVLLPYTQRTVTERPGGRGREQRGRDGRDTRGAEEASATNGSGGGADARGARGDREGPAGLVSDAVAGENGDADADGPDDALSDAVEVDGSASPHVDGTEGER